MKIKITTIIFAILLVSSNLYAQTEKGRFVIGANTAFDAARVNNEFSNVSSTKTTTFRFQPRVGYFILDNFVLGLSGKYDYQANSSTDASISLLSEFKYYFGETKIRPFAQANVGYGTGQFVGVGMMETQLQVSVYDINGMVFGGGAGLAFFVNDNISLDLGLQYLRSNFKSVHGTLKAETVKVKKNDFNVFVGFSVYL